MMTSMLTGIFIVIQLLSFAVMLLFVHEYKRISHKHEDLVYAIEPGVKPSCTLQSTVIIWLYIILLFSTLIGTSVIFFLEP